jgi:hypothetical protein
MKEKEGRRGEITGRERRSARKAEHERAELRGKKQRNRATTKER